MFFGKRMIPFTRKMNRGFLTENGWLVGGLSDAILVGAVVQDAAPTKIVLTFSEDVTGSLGWSVKINGADATGETVTGTGNTRTITINETIQALDVVTVAYDPGTGDMQDAEGEDFPAFVARVTNNVLPVWESDILDFSWPIDVQITPYDVTVHTDDTGYTYTTQTGAWPAGIKLSIEGIIDGTPTAGGTFAGISIKAKAGQKGKTGNVFEAVVTGFSFFFIIDEFANALVDELGNFVIGI